MAGYTPPEFNDNDPRFPVDEVKLRQLGEQYTAVATDALDPSTPVGAAVRQVAIDVGGGSIGYVDNHDGTLTLTPGTAWTDNGDGTITIGA